MDDNPPRLKVVGDGPQLDEYKSEFSDLSVEFTGLLTPVQAQEEIAKAWMIVIPSLWYEGFPMVLRDSFAYGTPALVSNIGPLPDIISDPLCGFCFEPGNKYSLYSSLRRSLSDKQRLIEFSVIARKLFYERYSQEVNYKSLISIYEKAIAFRQLR